jgi:hypothetical protein
MKILRVIGLAVFAVVIVGVFAGYLLIRRGFRSTELELSEMQRFRQTNTGGKIRCLQHPT